MRLWSLHPSLLDTKGLVAVWREGLLAKKVLEGQTKGYQNHPQLIRFKQSPNPLAYINYYLYHIQTEAVSRGYRFNQTKVDMSWSENLPKLAVNDGQLEYELEHLKRKIITRDQFKFSQLQDIFLPPSHPIFMIVSGSIEPWEIL